MIVERHGVVLGASRGDVRAFARVIAMEGRLVIALADGHTCGFDGGVETIARAVLDAVEPVVTRSVAHHDAFVAARDAFERAVERYPEDQLAGGPAAQLTIVEVARDSLRATRLGFIGTMVAHGGHGASAIESAGVAVIARVPGEPIAVEAKLAPGDRIVVAYPWLGIAHFVEGRPIATPFDELAREHSDPSALVAAALVRHAEEVRALRAAGKLIGELAYVVAATCV